MSKLSRTGTIERLESAGIIAIFRTDDAGLFVDVCRAMRDGGVFACEVTMTTPGALEILSQAVDKLGDDHLVGVGSVLDAETARAAILAGAQFIVSPTYCAKVVEMAHRYGLPAIPGAVTPTEILTAWQNGADIVKIFPASQLGPRYLKEILAPMPQLHLMPTGGVNVDNASDWLDAGATCLGLGTALVRKDLVLQGDWKTLTQLAKQLVDRVRQARAQ